MSIYDTPQYAAMMHHLAVDAVTQEACVRAALIAEVCDAIAEADSGGTGPVPGYDELASAAVDALVAFYAGAAGDTPLPRRLGEHR